MPNRRIPAPYPDSYWWDRLKSGEIEALEQLYQTHIASLLKFGDRICFDRELVRDSIQDVFVELWEHREGRAAVQNSRFYLFRMLKSHLSKKLAARGKTLNLEDVAETAVEEAMHVEGQLIAQETDTSQKRQLAAALERLTRRQREAILLRFYENFSYDEIAELMAISYQGVVNLVHKGTVSLRRHLHIELAALLGTGLTCLSWLEQTNLVMMLIVVIQLIISF